MNPLLYVETPDWRSLVLALLFVAPWLVVLVGPWLKRYQVWLLIVAGAVLFPPSIAWIQVPIQYGLEILRTGMLPLETSQKYWWLFALPLALVSGAVQEGVKFGLAVVGIAWTHPQPSVQPGSAATGSAPTIWTKLARAKPSSRAGLATGAAVGAGYGGMEAFWVFNLIFASGFTWGTVQQYGIITLLGFAERFFAVMFHVGAASLSAYGYATGRPWRYLLLAIGLHSLLNYPALLAQAGQINILVVELVAVLSGIGTMAAAIWLWVRHRPGKQEMVASESGNAVTP